jgi:hypothetical protein
MAPLEVTRQRLQDRIDVLETMYRYCRYADTQDARAMTDLFTEDCVVSYFGGRAPVYRSRSELYTTRKESLAKTLSGSHHITNAELFWETQDCVSATMHMYSWQRFKSYPATADCHRWGRYECRFVREDAGWRISHLILHSAGEYGGARSAEQLACSSPPHFEFVV